MGAIISWITSGALGAILAPVLNFLLNAQKQKLDAAGSHEARVSELAARELALDQREAEVNASVVIAEQGNWITRSIRPALAFPVIVIAWKLIIWDKALGDWTHGHTDQLDAHMWSYVNCVVISYMGGRSAELIATKIANVFGK